MDEIEFTGSEFHIISHNPDIYLSFADGVESFGNLLLVAIIFSVACLVIAFMVGIRKRDCLTYLITSLSTKTIFLTIIWLLRIIISFSEINSVIKYLIMFLLIIGLLLVCSLIEAIIFNKVLKNKPEETFSLAIICNFESIMISIIIAFITVIVNVVILII